MSKNYKKDLLFDKFSININFNNVNHCLSIVSKINDLKIDLIIPNGIIIDVIDNFLRFKLINEKSKNLKSKLGTYRTIIKNYFLGIKKPFMKILFLKGLGFKLEEKSQNVLCFYLNKSHSDIISVPTDIKYEVINEITLKLFCYDKSKLGFLSSKICRLRKYNVYTGFGILDSSKIYKRKKVRKVETK